MGMGRRAAGAGPAADEAALTPFWRLLMSEEEIAELLELWRRHPETHEEIWALLEVQEELQESA